MKERQESKMTPRFLALANGWKMALFIQMENSLEGKIRSSFLEMVGPRCLGDIQTEISNK